MFEELLQLFGFCTPGWRPNQNLSSPQAVAFSMSYYLLVTGKGKTTLAWEIKSIALLPHDVFKEEGLMPSDF